MATVLFGISGSIAAFKGLELIRLLVGDGVDVVPILSKGGAMFVTRTSVEALAGRPVVTEIFPEHGPQEIEHIALAQAADLFITCPASADIIAKYAMGIGDDPLALAALAYGTPHFIAPAMNHRMWENPATKANVEILESRGYTFIGPDKGMMACGEEGWGRLVSIEEIYGRICAELGKSGPLAGRKVLVSSGATKESIDDIRYVTNRSTGLMGHAIAAEARNLGAQVILVTSADLPSPAGMRVEKVNSADEMHAVIMAEVEYLDAVVMAAAVADFKPSEKTDGKIKKGDTGESIELKLVRNPDILQDLAGGKNSGQIFVGFAAEYGPGGREEAIRKCREKSCDFVCLNDVSREDIGFGAQHNEITIIAADGKEETVPKGTKAQVAKAVMSRVTALLGEVEKRYESTENE